MHSDLANTRVIISVSGGKDSTVCYAWAIEQFGAPNIEAVFADTGHEHPVTLNYIRNLPDLIGGPPIHWVKADLSKKLEEQKLTPSGETFPDMVRLLGFQPNPVNQYCTRILKLEPIRDWLFATRQTDDREPIMICGIRAEESANRRRKTMWEWVPFFKCETYRPLLNWTKEDVWNYLEKHQVPPNPLYEIGYPRVGCFPCIHADKGSLAQMPQWAWDKLARWEEISGRRWFPDRHVPEKFRPATLENVRLWARTSRDGSPLQDLVDIDTPGCMAHWGLCE